MPGTVLALEHCAQLGHVDPGLVAGRVHLRRGRGEDDVDAVLAGELEVASLVSRVAVQVGGLTELGGIDEEAQHDRVAPVARRGEQREVPRVEGAHGGHQADRTAPSGPRARP